MDKVKRFFQTLNSFCVDHKREIGISLMVLLFSVIAFFVVFNVSSCRGFWALDAKIESQDATVTTKINYQDNDFPVVDKGVEEKE